MLLKSEKLRALNTQYTRHVPALSTLSRPGQERKEIDGQTMIRREEVGIKGRPWQRRGRGDRGSKETFGSLEGDYSR